MSSIGRVEHKICSTMRGAPTQAIEDHKSLTRVAWIWLRRSANVSMTPEIDPKWSSQLPLIDLSQYHQKIWVPWPKFTIFQSYNKVNRFLARYSLRATNQPNNSAPNETYMCQKKHIFWGKWPFLGPNILIICEGAKVLVHTYQKTTEAPRSHCFLGQAWHQMDHIGWYLAQNDQKCKFWANLAVSGHKILIFTGKSKRFGTNITEKPPKHLVCIVFWSVWDQMGQKC